MLALFAASLYGCASPDPKADYQRARELVSERTGVQAAFQPDDEKATEERVEALLDGGLSIYEAVQLALLNNPEFQSLVAEIGASRADLTQSTLLTNPTISLGLQFPEGGGLTDLTFGFSQQLADLWQIPIRKRIAEVELERAILAVGQRAVEVIAETRSRCYRVLALEQALTYTEENLRLVERAITLSESLFRAGEVSEFDVSLTRTSALDVQEELIATRGELEQARAELLQTLGLAARTRDVRLTESLPTASQPLPDVATLLEQALEDRFDARVALLSVRRAESALQLECRRFLPDLQIGVAFERGEQRALPDRKILADTARASIAAGKLTAPSIQSRGERNIEKSQIIDAKLGPTLALTLPIFDQNQAQIAKARARVIQARSDYAARAVSVAAEIQRSLSAARSAAEMLNFQQSQGLAQTQATLDGAERRYRAGEESVLVLLETQDALVKRRRAYVNTLRDFAVAMAQLEGAIGGRPLSGLPTASSAPAPKVEP